MNCPLPSLKDLSIPRCFKPEEFGEIKYAELHNFSDASNIGYSQCFYLRLMNAERKIHCSLVMGKARVNPLKSVSIPRLELTAALVSTRMNDVMKCELLSMISRRNYFGQTVKLR